MADLVLVQNPESLHIPYFAMEPEPQSYIKHLDLNAALDNPGSPKSDEARLFGRKTVTWIRERLDRGALIQLYLTRDYIPPQTALYLKWLKFRDDALRDEFLGNWPHYQIEHQIDKLESERNETTRRMKERVQRGGFDLSKINEVDRWIVAHRYCEMDSKIRDLDGQVRYLREAARLYHHYQHALDHPQA